METINKELKESCEYWIKRLEEIAKSEDSNAVDEFLENDVLEIKRVQTLFNTGWGTMDYIFLVTYGGPTIEINGYEGKVIGYWTPEKVEIPFTELAKEGYEKIVEALDEV